MCVCAAAPASLLSTFARNTTRHREGGVVVADNLRIPGAPEYVKWMQETKDFSYEPHSICLGPSALWLHDVIGVSVYRPSIAAA